MQDNDHVIPLMETLKRLLAMSGTHRFLGSGKVNAAECPQPVRGNQTHKQYCAQYCFSRKGKNSTGFARNGHIAEILQPIGMEARNLAFFETVAEYGRFMIFQCIV